MSMIAAGGAALVLGGVAIGAALAVPDEPKPAYVEHYVEDLELLPPPAASAAILSDATGGTLPGMPVTTELPVVTSVDVGSDDDGSDDIEPDAGAGRDDSSGPGSSGGGEDDPEDDGDDDEDDRQDDNSGPGSDSGSDSDSDSDSDSSGSGSGRDDG
jgi:hypothetical protein